MARNPAPDQPALHSDEFAELILRQEQLLTDARLRHIQSAPASSAGITSPSEFTNSTSVRMRNPVDRRTTCWTWWISWRMSLDVAPPVLTKKFACRSETWAPP